MKWALSARGAPTSEDVATRDERVKLCDINVAPLNEVIGGVVDARVGVEGVMFIEFPAMMSALQT